MRPKISIERHLQAKPSTDVFELAEQMEALRASPGWIALQEMIEFGRENLRTRLETEDVHTESEYARYMGFLNGLTVAGDLTTEVIEAANARREELALIAADEAARKAEEAAEAAL